MLKKYRVRLSDEERAALKAVVRKFNGSNQKVRRAQILLQADESGPGWTDAQITIAYGCRTRTVEQVRERLVTVGFTQTLEGKRRESPATEKVLNGAQEAQVIALRLGAPPAGYANWTLRLLARKVVELAIVASISHETIRTTLKKTA